MKGIKRIKKLIFFVLIALVPIIGAKAAGSVSVSVPSINMRAGTSTTFTVTATNAAGRVEISTTNGAVASISTSQGSNSVFLDNNSVTVTVNGVAQGSANIIVKLADVATYDREVLTNTYIVPVEVTVPDSNALLASLSVNGYTLSPAFDPNTDTYHIGEVSVAGVTVNARVAGRNARVNSGYKSLQYTNTERFISITVTAESGAQKTYRIGYTRPDNRSSTSTLSDLSVENYDIGFTSDSTGPYTITVPNKVESITINGVATDPNTSTVNGIGTFNLPNIGENKFDITVTAENGDTTVYTIIVMRSDVENIPSTTLVNLRVNEELIDLTGGDKTFLVGVDNNINELSLTYETTSNTSQYDVIGNENLKDGINIVTIKVSDSNVGTSTYTLIVNKANNNSMVIDNLNGVKDITKDVTFNTLNYQNPIINEELIKSLNNSNNSLIYNVTNKNKGLLYSIKFSKDSNLKSSIEPYFNKLSDEKVTYATNIPANSNIKLYVNNNFENNDSVKVYSYDEAKQEYSLVTTSNVKDYYIEFVTNGATKYVLSKDELHNVNVKKGSTNILTIVLIAIVVLLGGFIVFLIIKNKKLNEGMAINSSINDNKKVNMDVATVIGDNQNDKEKEEKEPEKKDFVVLEDKEPELKINNPFEEKKEVNPMEQIIPQVDVKPVVESKNNLEKDISRFPSIEEELKKNMVDEKDNIGREEIINPLSNKNDVINSYTVDLTSIEEEIKRHEFEEAITKRIQKSNAVKPIKDIDETNVIDLISVDEDIKRHRKESKGKDAITPIKVDDNSVNLDDPFSKKTEKTSSKEKVKVVDFEPYPNTSKGTKQKKLEDTGMIPIITEKELNNYNSSKRVVAADDF